MNKEELLDIIRVIVKSAYVTGLTRGSLGKEINFAEKLVISYVNHGETVTNRKEIKTYEN